MAQKDKISQNDIKANIYDTTELIIDFSGASFENISKYINKEFVKLFPPETYSREDTGLFEEELNSYESRNNFEMSMASKKRLLEKETVLRYYSKNKTEQISISSMFVSIKLIYKEHAHKFNDKIRLISNIMKFLMEDEYLTIDRITLNKRDSVICATLYRLYQCLNKNLFGDIAYELSRKNGNNTTEYFLRNDAMFKYEEYFTFVSRTVKSGQYESNAAYQGILQIDVNTDNFTCDRVKGDYTVKIINCFEKLNEICFKIFIEHITFPFAEDLIKGETNKVLGGFNKNARI